MHGHHRPVVTTAEQHLGSSVTFCSNGMQTRPPLIVASQCSSGDVTGSRVLHRSRSVTSQYSVTSSSMNCRGVSPNRSHVTSRAVRMAARTDNDPETGACRRLTLMPPPGNTVFDTGPLSATWAAPGSPTSWITAAPPMRRYDSETAGGPSADGYQGSEGSEVGPTPTRAMTVTQRGSFLAINQPPAEICESMLNIDYSTADCYGAYDGQGRIQSLQ